MNVEDLRKYKPGCNIQAIREDTGEVIYQGHNTITNTIKWLFARLCANVNPTDTAPPYPLGHESLYGIWGLAFGAGSPLWAAETQPEETPVQTALIQEFLRKPLAKINFVQSDGSGGWTAINTLSTNVSFQCTVNATTDNVTQSIREMGLIGGGSVSAATDMQTAPYFTGTTSSYANVTDAQNTICLCNYKTLSPLLLPSGVDVTFAWILQF